MAGNANSGRRPKPLEVRLSEGEGNAGYAVNGKKYEVEKLQTDPRPGAEVAVQGFDIPVCPSALDVRGQREWDLIWTSGWWLSMEHDFRQVEMVSRSYDLIDRYEAQIEIDGDTVTDRFGCMVEHPLHKAVDRQKDRIQKLLSILGFDPSARARLGILVTKGHIGLEKLKQEKTKTETSKAEAAKMAWE